MKISIAFIPDERERVMELVGEIKRIIKIRRFREPAPKDGFCHLYMDTSQR